MSAAKTPAIYEIVCSTNGKRYIGSTAYLHTRKSKHFHLLKRGTHENHHLQAAWNKYGPSSFEFRVLEHCVVASLVDLEQYHLIQYPRNQVFNIRLEASSNLGFSHSSDTKQRIRLSSIGRNFTTEHLEKLSVAGKARAKLGLEMHGAEAKLRSARSRIGKPSTAIWSDESRAAMAERRHGVPTRLGVPCSEETKRRISAGNKGKSHPKGIPRSAETRAKISATLAAKKALRRDSSPAVILITRA